LFMTAEEAAGVDSRPGSHPRRAGDRLPASYVNFYVANKCVVMPLYDQRWDQAARRTLRRLFPTREVIGVETREVLLGGGNIHCITQQIPAAARRRTGHKMPRPLPARAARNGTLPHGTPRKPLF
jgi:agmatine deiminase